jgi:hypothetical protein
MIHRNGERILVKLENITSLLLLKRFMPLARSTFQPVEYRVESSGEKLNRTAALIPGYLTGKPKK